MSKSKTTKTQLLAPLPATTQQQQSTSRSAPDEFHDNVNKAGVDVNPEYLQQNSESKGDIEHGAPIIKLECLIPAKQSCADRLKAGLDKVWEKLQSEPHEIKAGPDSDDKSARPSFRQWAFGDQAAMVGICIGLVAMLVVSAVNVFSTLVASEPVFIENPTLAVMISLLAPAGSLSLKFLSSVFEQYRNKKRFTIFVYLLTALTFLAWVSLFAQSHAGVAGGIDWESFGESDHTGATLTLLQMFSEVLIAASLALAAQDIYLRYHLPRFVPNPVYLSLKAEQQKLSTEYDTCVNELAELKAQLVVLKAKRNIFVDLDLSRMAALRAKRARMVAANDF